MAHQIAVFAENRPGRIERTTRVLRDAGINIRAMSIATSDSFGVIKLLVDRPDDAHRALSDEGMSASKREIVAVVMDDRPGGLHRIAEVLEREGVNIEGAYGFVIEDKKKAVLVIEVEKIPAAEKVLEGEGFAILSDLEVYNL